MLVRYRGINNKGVLERPGKNGRFWRPFLVHWNSQNVKNHAILLFHYSVRQKIGDQGPIKLRTIFPHTSVLSKPPQLPGPKNPGFHENPVFPRFTNKCLELEWHWMPQTFVSTNKNYNSCTILQVPSSDTKFRYQVQVPSSGTIVQVPSSDTKFRYQVQIPSSGTIVQVPSSGTIVQVP